MDRNFRKPARGEPAASPPSEAWLFAQALLGKPIPNPASAAAEARAKREQLEWLASFSTEHEAQLRRLQSEEAEARHQRELLQWLATFSTEHERELRRLQAREAEAFDAQASWERFYEDDSASLAEWAEVDHPRTPKGTPDGGQWARKGGGSGSPLFLAAVIQRNQTIAELTGIVTPGMIRSTRIATELQSAASLPGEVARAAAAGLGTGGKAVVNGFATAVKSVATLGLDTSQLELIGVSKEDRDRGYDTAAAISTASGQVLIAVGTGGLTSALSKGGSIARTASGALVAYDAAGNAVGVVKGVVDATQNRINLSNGAQVVGGLLGLAANVSTASKLATPGKPASPSGATTSSSAASADSSSTRFGVAIHGDMPTPRPGQNSHHGVMSEWMKHRYSRYNEDQAPAVLMPEANHHATYGVYNRWRSEMRQKLGGTFDWIKVPEDDMRALSEKMFDAAEVPPAIRQRYWAEFEKMKSDLQD